MTSHDPPQSNPSGEARKFLDKVKLHSAQMVHDRRMELGASVRQARAAKDAQVAAAHREAAHRMNSTRFDRLLYLRDLDRAILSLDAKHQVRLVPRYLGDATRRYPKYAEAFAVDQAVGQVFWAWQRQMSLYQSDLEGQTEIHARYPAGVWTVSSIALDTTNEQVYYVADGRIMHTAYGLQGPHAPFAVGPAAPSVRAIAVDLDGAQLYWIDDLGIYRAGLDGTNVRAVATRLEAPDPVDLAVDGQGGWVYWVDRELRAVCRVRRDGGRRVEHLYAVEHPMPGIALDTVSSESGLSREVYWTAREDRITTATNGIAGHWKLDDGDGERASISAGRAPDIELGSHVRVTHDLPPTSPPPPHALRFQGPADRLVLPQSAARRVVAGSFTIAVWVKTGELTTGTFPLLSAADRSFGLAIRRRKASFSVATNPEATQQIAILSKAELPAETWVHLAIVADTDAGQLTIYVDGEPSRQAGPPWERPATAPGTEIHVGGSGGASFRGLMAGLYVTDRALNPGEIKAGRASYPSGDLLAELPAGPRSVAGNVPPLLDPPRAALAFDGQGGHGMLATPAELGVAGGSFCVECWVFFDELGEGDVAILGNDTGAAGKCLRLGIRNKRPYVGFAGNDHVASADLEEKRWHHLAWAYYAPTGSRTIYVDGKAYGGGEAPEQPDFGEGVVRLGRWDGGSSFRGLMSDLRIWTVSRTDIGDSMRGHSEAYVARGPVDAPSAPERLVAKTAGGLSLLSQASADHEKRLLAYRKRRDAQEQAARDVAAAHAARDAAVAAKHEELRKAHADAAAQIDAKQAEHQKQRAANRARKAEAAAAASRAKQHAERVADDKRSSAGDRAAAQEAKARLDAAARKEAARAKLDDAKRERAKY